MQRSFRIPSDTRRHRCCSGTRLGSTANYEFFFICILLLHVPYYSQSIIKQWRDFIISLHVEFPRWKYDRVSSFACISNSVCLQPASFFRSGLLAMSYLVTDRCDVSISFCFRNGSTSTKTIFHVDVLRTNKTKPFFNCFLR